jgi:hypothetical protein
MRINPGPPGVQGILHEFRILLAFINVRNIFGVRRPPHAALKWRQRHVTSSLQKRPRPKHAPSPNFPAAVRPARRAARCALGRARSPSAPRHWRRSGAPCVRRGPCATRSGGGAGTRRFRNTAAGPEWRRFRRNRPTLRQLAPSAPCGAGIHRGWRRGNGTGKADGARETGRRGEREGGGNNGQALLVCGW